MLPSTKFVLKDGKENTYHEMLEEIDTNKDGVIDFNEFCAAMQNFIPEMHEIQTTEA